MDQDKEVYRGILLIPSKALIKNKWQQKYSFLYNASKSGISRLEVRDNPDTSKGPPFRIIPLENCIKITLKDSTHFTITTNQASFEFGTTNEMEAERWVGALQSVAFPDDRSFITSIEEDNDLYCPSGEGVFSVRIHSSEASERCGLNNTNVYILLLTSSSMKLKTTNGNLLFTWPYRFIRRYGCKNKKFTFEAGRKCDSGEGIFFFEHASQQEIFRCLASKMKSMKLLIKNESQSSILDCGNNQLHAAINMEARSRSPLPPSPTSSTKLHDIEHVMSTASSQNSICEALKPVFKTRATPTKPPRKTLSAVRSPSPPDCFLTPDELINKSTESLSHGIRPPLKVPDQPPQFPKKYLPPNPPEPYTSIHVRRDAWKTMGMDDIEHEENIDICEKQYCTWGTMRAMNAKQKLLHSMGGDSPNMKKTIDNYDELEFFGLPSKLNAPSSYKKVLLAQGGGVGMPTPPSFNDYDEVAPMGSEKRMADDSHLGYAQIRKELLKMQDNAVNHHIHNDAAYAVISKPKRV